MRNSVHDNWIYAQAVDHERCRLVLHTVWPHVEPPEYTDIAFEGVVVHHFEQQKGGGGRYPANVLFDAEEADPLFILGQYEGLLVRSKDHGWPVPRYDGLEDPFAGSPPAALFDARRPGASRNAAPRREAGPDALAGCRFPWARPGP